MRTQYSPPRNRPTLPGAVARPTHMVAATMPVRRRGRAGLEAMAEVGMAAAEVIAARVHRPRRVWRLHVLLSTLLVPNWSSRSRAIC